MDKYKAVAQTNSQVELHNKNPMLLPDIVDGRSFPAQLVVTSPGYVIAPMQLFCESNASAENKLSLSTSTRRVLRSSKSAP